ncbi:hypothetical protein FOA52_006636 [Chlamydomonas sp. UWO 241]|nr:hypothetical protein FOA52_006636 [Chlamydomonas sp. UWO 241]
MTRGPSHRVRLVYDNLCEGGDACRDVFWESTGIYGRSTVRLVSLPHGKVLRQQAAGSTHFAEGLAKLNGTLYQLVWQVSDVLRYSVPDLVPLGTSRVRPALADGGWGLTEWDGLLLASDSSATLKWLDPGSFRVVGELEVTSSGVPLPWLNELEIIDGQLWANVWQTNCIARVNLTTGDVVGWVLLPGLAARAAEAHPRGYLGSGEVLNGIAWDSERRRLFVTGKQWPLVFEVEVGDADAPGGSGLTLKQVHERCHPRGARMAPVTYQPPLPPPPPAPSPPLAPSRTTLSPLPSLPTPAYGVYGVYGV